MKGSIDYLLAIHSACVKAAGDCKDCPFGNKDNLTDNPCPRLTSPRIWDKARVNWMVTAPERGEEKC